MPTNLSEGLLEMLQDTRTEFPGLPPANLLSAVSDLVCNFHMMSEMESETSWRVNIWGAVMDKLLAKLKYAVSHREVAEVTNPITGAYEIPDMLLRMVKMPEELQVYPTVLLVEEKPANGADSNWQNTVPRGMLSFLFQ